MNNPSKNFTTKNLQSPYLFSLFMLYLTLNLVGNATVMKVVKFGPGLGVGGLFVIPLIFLFEDVIAEVYGYKISRLMLWLVLFSEFVFSACVLVIIYLPSPSNWHLQQSFNNVFGFILHIGPIAIIAVMCGRFMNIYAITKMKILMRGKYFWLRSIGSTAVGSALTLTIYYGLGFAGKLPAAEILRLSLSDYTVRILYAIFGGIPAIFLVNFLKQVDNIDAYDYGTDFNPFKLALNQTSTEGNNNAF